MGEARGVGRAPRRSDVWPEYIWRLNQKRQQRCPCAGCEDAASCARVYRRPVRHTDAVGTDFDDDDEDDGSIHSRGVEEGGLDRRGIRGYDRPKSKGVEAGLYDVPGSGGWMFCGRGSLKDRAGGRRTNSAEFQARPRSASLEQRAFRTAAVAKGCAARGRGGEGDFPVCGWQQHYDRPMSLYPLRPGPHAGHRRGCHGVMTRSSVGLRCFACELRLETMSEEWNRVGGFYVPGRNHGSHRAYDGGDSGYIQSDQEIEARSSGTGRGTSQGLYPELNYVIPSGMFAERKSTTRCHDDSGGDDAECDDYLMPLSANFKRFQIERDQSERYLAMNSGVASTRDRSETLSPEETARQKQQLTEIPQSDDDDERQREKEEGCDEITSEDKFLVSADKGESDQKPEGPSSVTSGKSVNDHPVEDEPEGKETAGDSVDKISILVDQKEGNESKKTPIEATETPGDADILPSSDNKELAKKESARFKEATAAAPPVATRAPRSHLDLLHMSPPPQCSFMVDHSYMNVADSSEKSVPFKNDDMEEIRNKEQKNVPKNNVDSIDEAAEEILYFASKTKTGNEYLAHWQDVARLNKQPGSQYVVLHKKASSGNNYCHTYLPTLRENLKNSCKTK